MKAHHLSNKSNFSICDGREKRIYTIDFIIIGMISNTNSGLNLSAQS